MKRSRFNQDSGNSDSSLAWLTAAGIGAGLMYLCDPQSGRRRRALLRDQISHARRLARDVSRVAARDFAGRSAGLIAQATRRLDGEPAEPTDSGLDDRLMQDNWSPAARVLTGSAGLSLIGRALRARGPISLALSLFGGGLLLRAATNRQLASLAGLGSHGRDIEVQKSITIRAPIAQVFQFWTRIRNFPSFMSRVRDVREIDDSRSYWRVAGPAGLPVEWTAEITRLVAEELIEWRCDDRASIKHCGRVRFERDGSSATRVHVRLRYFPPAGSFGHLVASLFGADPKSGLDADLMRMKSMLETGHAPHDAAQPASAQPRRDPLH